MTNRLINESPRASPEAEQDAARTEIEKIVHLPVHGTKSGGTLIDAPPLTVLERLRRLLAWP